MDVSAVATAYGLNKLTSSRLSFPHCFAGSFGCCQVAAGLPLAKHPTPRQFLLFAPGGLAALPGHASPPVNL